MIKKIICIALTYLNISNLYAVNPDEVLQDAELEKRARNISSYVKCLVCQNETIDESNAELAKQIRTIIREQLIAGKTDKEVYDFLVERYGEFVLLEPRLSNKTVLLWYSPLIFILLSFIIYLIIIRKGKINNKIVHMTEEEENVFSEIKNSKKNRNN